MRRAARPGRAVRRGPPGAPAGARRALGAASAALDPDVRAALEESISRVRTVHAAQRPAGLHVEVAPGAQVRQRWVPVRRVGLYVPGGLAVYPSSVVMNVVAAQVAGVGSFAVASPPQRDEGGLPDPMVLATCALLGIDEVYAVGGAQAIGDVRLRRGAAPSRDGRRSASPSTSSPARATCTSPRPSGSCAASSASTPRPAHRDRDPRRRRRPTLSTSPRTSSRRPSTTRSPRPCWSRRRSSSPARSRPSSSTGPRRRVHEPRVAQGATRPAVGDRARRRPRAGLEVVNAYGAEHLEIQTVEGRGARRRRSPARVRSSSAPTRRSRSATTWPGPTTCCRPVAARTSRAGSGCTRSCGPSR